MLVIPNILHDSTDAKKFWYLKVLEDARFIVYEGEREMKVISVSTCGLQGQLNKDKLSSNKAVNSSRLHIEHLNAQDKTILTRTFLDKLETLS